MHWVPGVANYLNLKRKDGTAIEDAAWYYPDCKVGSHAKTEQVVRWKYAKADSPTGKGQEHRELCCILQE